MLMVRNLAQRGMRSRDAAAVITISTTMQTVAQLIFALIGVVLLTGYATGGCSSSTLTIAVLGVIGVIGLMIFGFYYAQRRGLFGRAMHFASGIAAKFSAKRDWSSLVTRAEAVDAAVHDLYRERGKVAAGFSLSLLGWIVGTGEVWLALYLLGHPVGWTETLLLESLGQAIRGAAFAIPGSLGVQEGGYLLLARLVGLSPETALALSLAKRARELLLGVPGIVYLHFVKKAGSTADSRVCRTSTDFLEGTITMRAIILAAGMGLRLVQPEGQQKPKCLLRFGDASLLERHLNYLKGASVDEVVFVTGFKSEQIEAELASIDWKPKCKIVVNEEFTLGSVLSVHTARDAMTRGGDVLLMDADVLYDERIFDPLVAGSSVNRLLIDRDFEAGDEPVKLCVENGVPVELRKQVAAGLKYDTVGESVGFFRFDHATATRLAEICADYVASGRAKMPHEEAVRDLLLENMQNPSHVFDFADVTGAPWIEIDFQNDVKRAADAVLPQLQALRQFAG